jgi:hypothetical protein
MPRLPRESRNPGPAARGVDVSLLVRRDSNIAILLPFHVTLYVTTSLPAQSELLCLSNLPKHPSVSAELDRAYDTTMSTLRLAPAARITIPDCVFPAHAGGPLRARNRLTTASERTGTQGAIVVYLLFATSICEKSAQ